MLLVAELAGAVLTIARSSMGWSTVVASVSALLAGFGSVVVDAAVAVLLALVVPKGTLTVMVNCAVSPMPTLALEKVMLPVPPATGVTELQPVPAATRADANVVPV